MSALPNAQAKFSLNYAEHSRRLADIKFLVAFVMGAIGRMETTFPNEEGFAKAQKEIVAAFRMLLESVGQPPEFHVEQVKADVLKAFIPAERSRTLIHNLCFVMIVTQVEIFIEHLIDVILSAEPRRLRDLAGDKQLTARELVDAQNYDAVMKQLRQKIAKEVLSASPREMFERHLGQRFKLFRKEDLIFRRKNPSGEKEDWGIVEIEAVWKTRHRIVHEGQLEVDKGTFEYAFAGSLWIETFLSVKAREQYGLSIDSPEVLDISARMFNLSKLGVVEKVLSTLRGT